MVNFFEIARKLNGVVPANAVEAQQLGEAKARLVQLAENSVMNEHVANKFAAQFGEMFSDRERLVNAARWLTARVELFEQGIVVEYSAENVAAQFKADAAIAFDQADVETAWNDLMNDGFAWYDLRGLGRNVRHVAWATKNGRYFRAERRETK